MYAIVALLCTLQGECKMVVPDPPIPVGAFYTTSAECVEGGHRVIRDANIDHTKEWLAVNCVNFDHHLHIEPH